MRIKSVLTSLIIFVFFVSSQLALGQEFQFLCYSGDIINPQSEINQVRIGWSQQSDWSSFVVYRRTDGKLFSEDASCPTYPKTGACGIFDDGGFFEITPQKGKPASEHLLLKMAGLPILQKGDAPDEWRIRVQSGGKTLVVPLTKTSKALCRYF